jgi:hypothetical protein
LDKRQLDHSHTWRDISLRVSPLLAAMALQVLSTVPASKSCSYNRMELGWQLLVAVFSVDNSQPQRRDDMTSSASFVIIKGSNIVAMKLY